jgi:hypothetical protein
MAMKKPADKQKSPKVKKRTITEEMDIDPADPVDNSPEDTAKIDKEEGGYAESDDVRDFSGYDKNLHEYMETAGGVKDYTATLYKYDNLNKQKQYVCNSSQNEIMTMNDVGMSFGSGEYRYLVTFPVETKVPPKAFRFNIHPVYDEYRKKAGMTDLPDPRNNPNQQGKNSMLESMEMMKMMIELMKPLIAPVQPQSNPMEMMLMNYRMTQDVLKSNLKENVGLYRELANIEKSKGDDMGNFTEEKEAGILDTILPLIERFAPLILGGGFKSQAVVQAVKAAPEFKKAIQSPNQLQALIQAVEAKIGKEETVAILKKLNVKRPG